MHDILISLLFLFLNSVHDVVSLASGIQKDSHFLLNYIKAIHEYLKVLDKYVQ